MRTIAAHLVIMAAVISSVIGFGSEDGWLVTWAIGMLMLSPPPQEET